MRSRFHRRRNSEGHHGGDDRREVGESVDRVLLERVYKETAREE